MELEQLRIFCTVAACRSFTRAAKQLFVSHSTTSRAVVSGMAGMKHTEPERLASNP